MTEWQPIETAPRDGKRVLLYNWAYGAGSGHYDKGWWQHFCLSQHYEPTHWMPLPDPPKEQAA